MSVTAAAAERRTAFSVREIRKSFGHTEVLHGISMDFRAGWVHRCLEQTAAASPRS